MDDLLHGMPAKIARCITPWPKMDAPLGGASIFGTTVDMT
jgi:hypothetical protein